MYPKSLQNLIESFKSLPGVGEKTAERYALAMVESSDSTVEALAQSLIDVKQHLQYCHICGNFSDYDTCEICMDSGRDKSMIVVVASSKDVLAMEKTGAFHGVYHVLNGLISPSKGKLPQDLNIDSLLERAKDAKEVILATNTTIDGETTAMYLDKLFQKTYPELVVTRLAHGLPSGGLLDYADDLTLTMALDHRHTMK